MIPSMSRDGSHRVRPSPPTQSPERAMDTVSAIWDDPTVWQSRPLGRLQRHGSGTCTPVCLFRSARSLIPSPRQAISASKSRTFEQVQYLNRPGGPKLQATTWSGPLVRFRLSVTFSFCGRLSLRSRRAEHVDVEAYR